MEKILSSHWRQMDDRTEQNAAIKFHVLKNCTVTAQTQSEQGLTHFFIIYYTILACSVTMLLSFISSCSCLLIPTPSVTKEWDFFLIHSI